MIPEALIALYLRVVDVDLNRGYWCKQTQYRPRLFEGPFFRGGPDRIADMLAGKYWIVHAPPSNHPTRWLRFDLDAAADSHGLAQRDQRYEKLRQVMGLQHRPVVWGTPSGCGIRVAYPIAPTPVVELLQSQEHGLVPEVLRTAGMEPELGQIEIFPRPRCGDRLPLGRRMPFLDPETLHPLPGFDWRDEAPPSQTTIERGLTVLERAVSNPCRTLITDLRARDRKRKQIPASSPDDSDAAKASRIQRPSKNPVILEPADKIFKSGLTRPSSRDKTEYVMAVFAHEYPERFQPYGLTDPRDPTQVARALVEWLARNHNGWSHEWNQEARRGESAAKEAFLDRYLKPNQEGITFIDRARRKASGFDPLAIPTLHMARVDRERLLTVVEKAIHNGAQRWKAEVWSSAFGWQYNAYRWSVRHNGGNSRPPSDGQEMAAERMEQLPYGQGRSKATGQERYVMYRSMLEAAGWVTVVRDHLNVPGDGTGRARAYRLQGLTRSTHQDLVFDGVHYRPKDVKAVLHEVPPPPNRDAATLHDVYHDLFLVSRPDLHLGSRYGRRTAQRVRSRADAVRELLT